MLSFNGSLELRKKKMADLYPKTGLEKLRQVRRQLKQLKQEISELSKKNYELEKDVQFFDQRIALLINHRITVEELSHRLLEGDRRVGVLKDDLQQQKYGNLFYLLQTEPYYLAQLTRVVSMNEIDDLLQPVMFSLYGNQYETREEHLLLSMFELSLTCEVEESENLNSILRANTPISRMMTRYTKRGPGQEYLKFTLEEPLKELMAKSNLILEINPVKVYSVVHDSTNEGTNELTMEKALDDQEVQSTIKYRMKLLEEISSYFLAVIISSLEQVPYGIRWLCSAIKSLVQAKYPEASPDSITAMIGGFFLLRFVNPAIVTPHVYRLVDKQPSQTMRRNLTLIAKLVQSIANRAGISTSFKEVYMHALEPFALRSIDTMQGFLNDLCNVPDFHESLELEHYMSLSKDIHIDITLNEMYRIHELMLSYQSDLALTEDDPLNVILSELGPPGSQLNVNDDITINLHLTNRWNASKVSTRHHSYDGTLSRQIEGEVLKEQCRLLLTEMLSMSPSLMEEASLVDAINRANEQKDSDVYQFAEYILYKYQGFEEFTTVIGADDQFYSDLKQEVRLKLLRCERLESEFRSLQGVYDTLHVHKNFLKEQLDAYKEYLVTARNRAASVNKRSSSFGSKAAPINRPIKLAFTQLEKDGIVIESRGVEEKKKGEIFVIVISPEPGIYKVSIYYKGLAAKAYETELHLEELLELQHLRDPVLYLDDFVVLDVRRTLLLLHKHFSAA